MEESGRAVGDRDWRMRLETAEHDICPRRWRERGVRGLGHRDCERVRKRSPAGLPIFDLVFHS